jgi:hypothetical protein
LKNERLIFSRVLSKGAQKNFAEFTARFSEQGNIQVDEIYFKHLVAKAILFKSSEKIVQAQNFGSSGMPTLLPTRWHT